MNTLPLELVINGKTYVLEEEQIPDTDFIIPNWWTFCYREKGNENSLPPYVGSEKGFYYLASCYENREAALNDMLDRLENMKYDKKRNLLQLQFDMKTKVFLGGTCNESTWRDEIIPQLTIDYFNPVVDDWTPQCQAEEERQRNELCNLHLYVITSRMTGVFSIAEAVESAITKHEKCIFCYLDTDGELTFTKGQKKSLDAVGNMVTKYNAYWVKSLNDVLEYLNTNA